MLAFIVTLHSGRRFTVRAAETRFAPDGALELLAAPAPTDADPLPGKQVVALFAPGEVVAVVAREHLISEEPSEPVPHTVPKTDPIPF